MVPTVPRPDPAQVPPALSLPSNWTELLARLAARLGPEDSGRRDAEEWLREAVEARWGVTSLHDLDRGNRALAFQKSSGVLLAVEEDGLPDELVDCEGNRLWLLYRDGSLEPVNGYIGRRAALAAIVSRYFDGIAVEGPPWKVTDLEDLPTYDEYAASAVFM